MEDEPAISGGNNPLRKVPPALSHALNFITFMEAVKKLWAPVVGGGEGRESAEALTGPASAWTWTWKGGVWRVPCQPALGPSHLCLQIPLRALLGYVWGYSQSVTEEYDLNQSPR